MRRSDREINERSEIDAIIRRHSVLYLALWDAAALTPYVIPMTYGYDGECLYMHAALEGRKLDLMRQNPQVAFAIEAEYEVKPGTVACGWDFMYESVVGTAEADLLQTPEDKTHALDVLMSHFDSEPQTYPAEALAKTVAIRLRITSVTGKRNR